MVKARDCKDIEYVGVTHRVYGMEGLYVIAKNQSLNGENV